MRATGTQTSLQGEETEEALEPVPCCPNTGKRAPSARLWAAQPDLGCLGRRRGRLRC